MRVRGRHGLYRGIQRHDDDPEDTQQPGWTSHLALVPRRRRLCALLVHQDYLLNMYEMCTVARPALGRAKRPAFAFLSHVRRGGRTLVENTVSGRVHYSPEMKGI